MCASNIRVVLADWERDEAQLRCLREAVFVREQHVPPELEWDGLDAGCIHAIAYADHTKAVGTGRLLPDGHIGRMAVLKAWRGRGVGSQLLQKLMEVAKTENLQEVVLNAQTHALDFYRRHGFVAEGDEFDDAGIPHRRMVRRF